MDQNKHWGPKTHLVGLKKNTPSIKDPKVHFGVKIKFWVPQTKSGPENIWAHIYSVTINQQTIQSNFTCRVTAICNPQKPMIGKFTISPWLTLVCYTSMSNKKACYQSLQNTMAYSFQLMASTKNPVTLNSESKVYDLIELSCHNLWYYFLVSYLFSITNKVCSHQFLIYTTEESQNLLDLFNLSWLWENE